MLHLENFFEKSFALLLTTPNQILKVKKCLTFYAISGIITKSLLRKRYTTKIILIQLSMK